MSILRITASALRAWVLPVFLHGVGSSVLESASAMGAAVFLDPGVSEWKDVSTKRCV
jgi:hypothetical protein